MKAKALYLFLLLWSQGNSFATDESLSQDNDVKDFHHQFNCGKPNSARTPIKIILRKSVNHHCISGKCHISCSRQSHEKLQPVTVKDFGLPKGLVAERKRLIEALIFRNSISLKGQEFCALPVENPFKKPIIKQLNLSIGHHFTGKNYPVGIDIRYFLAKTGFSKKNILHDPHTQVKNMDASKGAYTAFLYKVKLSDAVASDPQATKLIVKGITNHHRSNQEAVNLNYLRIQSDVTNLHTCKDCHVPILALDAQNFWYDDPETHKRIYFTILKKVPGKKLEYYLDEYWDSNFSKLKTIFTKVGRALGEFHYRLAQPVAELHAICKHFDQYYVTAHHDFHARNILYSLKHDRVGFIDLESMAATHLRNVPYWHDIFRFYMKTKYMDYPCRDFVQMNTLMSDFVKGYIQAYPLAIQTSLQKDIIQRIQSWSEIYKLVLLNCIPAFEIDYYDPVYFSLWIRKYLYKNGILDAEYIKSILVDSFEDL
ncbi:MAG TPA: hypothetical protein VNJ29_03695 [Candidatus Nitrosotenuis sp.]|jgi:hypothetical protein|nr:hypothetical protein [Candidatus Nitrosotenuis sp.]